ncbi:MAG: SafA/ExsA family spore coat assembly protein [Ruminococcaceae bacterium]|nr:SafA/ExsA family spore coat assembly protein [Oscillospiraceae bacterium]
MKKLFTLLSAALLTVILSVSVFATSTHTVVKGDSLWKIAVRYEVGLSEIKSANPQIKNYDLIYPGQVINLPMKDQTADSYEREVVRLVNKERTQRGLKALTYDWQLSRVARYKSQDMSDNNYFSHTSPTYGSPFEMMKKFGISYRSAGENIAKGQRTPEEVVNAWMNSSGHRANILSTSFTKIGVGYVSKGKYWTQMFIS